MDDLLFLDVLCSQEFSGFQVLGLSLLPLDFSFILPIVSRLLQLYSTDNKTSRLMVKRFSTVRDNQRDSELHEEKEREEGDRGEQEERRGDSRGERPIYAVIHSQSVLHSPDTHKDPQNWIGKRRGKEEIEVF